MKRWFLATTVGAALAALAFTVGLIAQPVGQNQLTGNECWSAGQGPSGPSQFLCLNTFRATSPNVVLTAVAGNFTIGVTTNVTVASGFNFGNVTDGGSVIITAQPAAAVITMPNGTVSDGAVIRICNGTNAAFATNAVTVAAGAGQTMVPTGAAVTLTTLAAATCVAYQWAQANTSWYKVQ